MVGSVADFRSNANEQIEHAAKVIGRSVPRRKVFEAIYNHKTKAKCVSVIVERTKLSRMRVLQEARHLVKEEIVGQTKKNGEIAYEMYQCYHRRKRQILSLIAEPKRLDKLPTKRKVVLSLSKSVSIPLAGARVVPVTIDDVASFSKTRRVKANGYLPSTVSEKKFKKGMEKVLSEASGKKDWGGERNDLFTTRLNLKKKRVAAAFAFKGPGTTGTLTPRKMGKNGDQIQRLFQTDAIVFFVQYWRDIDESVLEQMRTFAVVKSLANGERIYYGIIDGADSYRLYRAYSQKFNAG